MILDNLVQVTKKRIDEEKRNYPIEELKKEVKEMPKINPEDVYQRFRDSNMHIIGEVKQASPSKGTIVDDFPYLKIAQEYDQSGVTAISVLTEPHYFKGSLKYLRRIADEVDVPVLRKDFTIDPYMLYQARVNGARLVLLIVAVLTKTELQKYLKLAHDLGLAAIVEAHDKDEVKTAIEVGAQIIGVNNRNLKNFTVSFQNSIQLRPLVPSSIPFISESGVKTVADVKTLKENNINGALIGETLMRSNHKEEFIKAIEE